MDPETIAFATAQDLQDAYKRGDTDPASVVEALLRRIANWNPRLNAYRIVLPELAEADGAASAARWRAGRALGPLDGVPVAIKDLADIPGTATTSGSAALLQNDATHWSTVAQRLRGAGAIILGKTQMVEFACGGWGTNQQFGTPWNPWDLDVHRIPGGSSSGSAVAVAAGLATAALGTDTGGSVRIPAGLCGLTGLKTCVGRVSTAGIQPLSPSLDTVGPLARTPQDAAQIYAAIHGPDARDPKTFTYAPEILPTELGRSVSGLRVGLLSETERADIDPGVLARYDDACRMLDGLGAVCRVVEMPEPFAAIRSRCGALIMSEGFRATRHWIEREDLKLDANVRARLLGGGRASAADYQGFLADREVTRKTWAQAMRGIDAFLTPTSPQVAPRLEDVDEQSFTLARFTRAGNYLDLAAVALPLGLVNGLPTSLQIHTRPGAERKALEIAAAIDAGGTGRLLDRVPGCPNDREVALGQGR